ncbi:MAG: alpha/beta fold hydrolase [Dehalococcoidia bacterium]|nr:alpha/beta fold hydrolase [Dehalococcoidia bacterium]
MSQVESTPPSPRARRRPKRYQRPASIDDDPSGEPRPTLIPLREEGHLPSLYFLPGFTGTVFQYLRLAPLLGDGQPVYAFESRGMWDGTAPLDEMNAIADDHLSQLRAHQPHGPYFLLGFSMGGSVAWEMAARLLQDGEQVFLGLLDPPRPDRDREATRASWFARRRHRAEVWVFHLQTFMPLSWPRKRAYLREPMRGILRRSLRTLGMGERSRAIALKTGRRPPPGALACRQANLDALDGFVPLPLDADIALFRGKIQNPGMRADRTLGWGDVALRGIEVHDVPGLHPYIFVEPHVKVLAREIRSWAEARRALIAEPDVQAARDGVPGG